MGYKLLVGDCRDMLRTLPDGSVHCVVTSPPYWGLRDYGTATWEGGDPECAHRVGGQVQDNKAKGAIVAGVRPGVDASRCLDCGAQRVDSQLGLEPTPDEYVANMVEVFREVRRVLRDDGTLWLNLGDSYSGSGKGAWANKDGGQKEVYIPDPDSPQALLPKVPDGLKPKDLIGIPWRVAFALQADGWYLRSDIIWSKPNPMPESVRDRPTKAHEYVFLLSKSERYFYDADAIKEPAVSDHPSGNGFKRDARLSYRDENGARGNEAQWEGVGSSRNARSVWTINTRPYPGAHFATFPPELAERCILAGTSQHGCCRACGSPYTRATERVDRGHDGSRYGERAVAATGGAKSGGTARSTLGSSNGVGVGTRETVGWEASCECDAGEPVPCTALDPFGGSGTVGMVATGHGRDAVLIELNPEYGGLIRDRIGVLFEDTA